MLILYQIFAIILIFTDFTVTFQSLSGEVIPLHPVPPSFPSPHFGIHIGHGGDDLGFFLLLLLLLLIPLFISILYYIIKSIIRSIFDSFRYRRERRKREIEEREERIRFREEYECERHLTEEKNKYWDIIEGKIQKYLKEHYLQYNKLEFEWIFKNFQKSRDEIFSICMQYGPSCAESITATIDCSGALKKGGRVALIYNDEIIWSKDLPDIESFHWYISQVSPYIETFHWNPEHKDRIISGPFTLAQLHRIKKTTDLEILRAEGSSEWCLWEKAKEEYPELNLVYSDE